MKKLLRGLIVAVLCAAFAAYAQSGADEEAVRNVPQAFAAAWAKHDGHELGKIMSDDVDFVNVAAAWVHGREDFTALHSRLLSGPFKDSTLTPLEVKVRFLRPDLAVLHWSWRLESDRNMDLTARSKPRLGLFTMVVEKRSGVWLVVVAQNTNWTPAPNPDPVMGEIKTAISFPKADGP